MAESRMRPKASKAWEHFVLNTPNKSITCKLCKAELAWHGSTTVMNEHLKRKHVGITEEREASGQKKQRTITDFVQKNAPCTPQQSAIATAAILKMLVTDMRPLSMVEDTGFKSMVTVLNPGYTLPSRTRFTKLMEQEYQKVFQRVKETIKKAEGRIAVTTDIWTSVATEAYLGVTVHYIEDDWEMKTICLTTLPLEDRHTATNIAEWLEEVIAKFEIAPEKVIALVHDNGANIVGAANIVELKHGWSSIRCTGHTLQLVVSAALKNPVIERAVGAARCVIEHFKKSELASSKLKEKQKQMGTAVHQLIQDIGTRWNSTYYMVSRLLEQRWPVTATLSDPSTTHRAKHYLDLKPDQWSILEELVTALKPFECATVFISGQEYPTISSVPALIRGLMKSNEAATFESSSLKCFQETVTEQLQIRWNRILFEQVPNTVVLSSALDPRFRRLKFLTAEQIINVHAKVQTEALAIRREIVQQPQATTSTATTSAKSSSAVALIDTLLESGGSSEEESIENEQEAINNQVRNEVQAFFAERPLAKEKNPLTWWRGNQEKYPTLAKLAKSYMCIPATSTPSERLFSAAADVAQQFQYAVRVIGSNFAPTVERDEFLVAEKIKKEFVRQRREADGALFSELHRKLQSQGVVKNRWAILYLLLSLSEDPRKQPNKVSNYATLFAQALPRDAHSTPYYYARPQTLQLNYQDRNVQSVQNSAALGSSGIGSIGMYTLNGPTPPPQSFVPGQSYQTPAVGDSLRQQLGTRLAWTLATNQQPALQNITNKCLPNTVSRNVPRTRREGEMSGSVEITESSLVRDILYVFQGIDGKCIKMCNSENCYKVDSKVALSKSLKDTTGRLAELGWLHNKIRKYTDQRSLDRAFGLVGQSFCAALHHELKEYYRLLSVLHSQLQAEDDQGVNLGLESSLTLRRLLVWTYDPKIRLKTLAALVDHCQGRKGGELASAVHAYSKTGDPYMRSLVQHILGLVSHPIVNFLYRWIYDGELEDTYHEFFVASDPTVKTDRLWHDKYTLRKSMIPTFITMDQSRKVLLIGKSINFLHQVCHDQTPTAKMMAVAKTAESPKDAADLFTDLENAFQSKIDAAYFETSKYLLDVLNKNYNLLEHLQAMRRYLLLGQGDFIRHLMDLLKPELVRPATTLYQHNLTGILETAVRATNAQFDNPEILKRLDVRLLEVSPGDTGWDVFSLDYHVDGPIATVFTRECMNHYLRVFNFLWRAKRMEYILTDIWKGHMCNAKLLKSMPELSGVLHQCHVLASEMVHFIHQMQYYITFEVLECSWDELWNKVLQAQDLDHIIAAHEVFLDTIICRCLLDSDSRALINQLRAVFDQIINFQNAQDAMYRASLEELQRRLQFEERKKERESEGKWGVTEAEEEEENKRVLEFQKSIPKMRSQLLMLTHFYQDIVQQFLVLLTTSTDESLRFLSFRLDFNEHYKAREPRLRMSLGTRGRRSLHA